MFVVIRLDPYSIVPDVKNRFSIFFTILTDLDPRIRLITYEFSGIIEQVLQDLRQTLAISVNGG